MSRSTLMQKVAKIAFILLTVAMLFLFFSNDFGLVDIHKASIVVAVGVDVTESGYEVTAQAAVPTPAQGEGSAAYTQVTGEGVTVAEAVDDINAKTGFYPKLAFCNLVILFPFHIAPLISYSFLRYYITPEQEVQFGTPDRRKEQIKIL